MKILSITEFTTAEGTGKETTMNLDTRAGVFFRVVTGAFETPPFTASQETVPVMMLHGDREQKNVTLKISENILTITQGYRLATHGFLIAQVNNDWADANEVQSVLIDSLEIASAKLNSGITVDITTSINEHNVRLTSTEFTPNAGEYFSQEITTKDGKHYIFVNKWFSHQYSSDPVRYDYIYASIGRVISAYTKP